MKILYFSWLREQIGIAEEIVSPPASVTDVKGLLDWLASRDASFKNALQHRTSIRMAVNLEYAGLDTRISQNDEIALFPPVTGG